MLCPEILSRCKNELFSRAIRELNDQETPAVCYATGWSLATSGSL